MPSSVRASIQYGHLLCGLVLAATMLPSLVLAESATDGSGFFRTLGDDVRADFRRHYSLQPQIQVAIGFGVAGVLANTNADARIQEFFNDELSSDVGDDLADLFTGVGDLSMPLYSFPVYLGAMWLGDYSDESESGLARWGADSMRAGLVGAPEVLVLSHVTGGNRPEEGEPGWSPFDNDAGVSGHAFFGAVPFITAANLTDRRWLKYTLLVTSTMPGLARVYDDKHYFSQSLLGWWIAYVSASTIMHTNAVEPSSLSVSAISYDDGAGVQFVYAFE